MINLILGCIKILVYVNGDGVVLIKYILCDV